jgi:hypothetical protein
MQKTILLGTRKGLIAYNFKGTNGQSKTFHLKAHRFLLLTQIQEPARGGPALITDTGE